MACLKQRRIALGESYLDTLNSMNSSAILFARQGPYTYVMAESVWADCMSKREVVLGADHPDTIRTKENFDRVRSMK